MKAILSFFIFLNIAITLLAKTNCIENQLKNSGQEKITHTQKYSSQYMGLKIAPIFSDYMVFQQQSINTVWGWAYKNQQITLSASWLTDKKIVTSDKNGYWKFELAIPKTDFIEHTIHIKSSTADYTINHILFGELWFCSGQSNMEYTLQQIIDSTTNAEPNFIDTNEINFIRQFRVKKSFHYKPRKTFKGNWALANSECSAVGFFFASHLKKKLKVPIGIINASYAGSPIESWISANSFNTKFKKISLKDVNYIDMHQFSPTVLFNSMISPLVGLKIKGFIWYQGEANVYQRPNRYYELFKEMICNWRDLWNDESLPFYFVQICPFDYGDSSHAPLIREAQYRVMSNTIHTGMVTTGDIGERYDIHPVKKNEIGERLANWALSDTYKIKGIDSSPPYFKNVNPSKNKMFIEFNEPLSYKKTNPSALYIAGKNKTFYPAEIVLKQLEGNTIIEVQNDCVEKPIAVRYEWTNWSHSSLYDTSGNPVIPFRTDSWKKVKIAE